MKEDPKLNIQYEQLQEEALGCLSESGFKLIQELKSFQDMYKTNTCLAMEAVFLASTKLGIIAMLKDASEMAIQNPVVSKHMKKAFARILEEQIDRILEVKNMDKHENHPS